jgi:hypothetical protein
MLWMMSAYFLELLFAIVTRAPHINAHPDSERVARLPESRDGNIWS